MGRLIRWEPMMGISRLRDEMNRLMEDFFGETTEERAPAEMMRIPSIDVEERENEVVVHAEMPGVDKDKIRVEATTDSLLLSAEIKKEEEKKEANYIRRERRMGTFQRIIPMPAEIKPADVHASYHDGVLDITLPKSEAAKSRQPVRVNIQ